MIHRSPTKNAVLFRPRFAMPCICFSTIKLRATDYFRPEVFQEIIAAMDRYDVAAVTTVITERPACAYLLCSCF